MIEWLQHFDLEVTAQHAEEAMPEWLFWTYAGISAALVTMAGLMSGLTLGLMSLDEIDLEVLKRSGTEQEKRHARRIMPVIANEHMLLVTLLLFNALSTEALPIFLDKLVDPVTAVVLSVSVVLVIGEILPQAVCRSFGLQVGSYSAWFVRLLMLISCPISWPIGKFIDWILGEEHTALFRRGQLKALVGLHSTDEGLGGNLTADEISIITGALDLTSKTAWTAMTPLDKVFMLASDQVLDEATLQEILISGHSRIPLHEPGDRRKLIGLILVKELVLVDPEQGLTAGQLVSRQLPCLPADTPMYQLLRLFESGGSHMVALTKPPSRVSTDLLNSSWSGALLSPAGKQSSGPLGFSRTNSAAGVLPPPAMAAGGMPRIRSGVIKAADKEIYVETQQQQQLQQGLGMREVDGATPCVGFGMGGLNPGAPQGGIDGVFEGLDRDGDLWGEGREGDPVGIITIEDVLEELLQQEIIDETDQYVDNMQNMRVDAYALTTTLPPRLRKAYHQQFTPRVGRLVVHHQHHHPKHPPGGGSWPRGDMSQQWLHMAQGFKPLYEGRAAVSNPPTPLASSPPSGGYQHQPPAAAAAAAAAAATGGGGGGNDGQETPMSRFSSESSSQFRYFMPGVLSPEPSLTEPSQQQQQLGQYWQQQDILAPDQQQQQQQQQGPSSSAVHHGYDQAFIRRSSGDGSGYVTYNIFSLPRRRSSETGQQQQQQQQQQQPDCQVAPEGSTHGGRSVLRHLQGGTATSQHPAVQFQAVREAIIEGCSPAAAADMPAAAGAANSAVDYDRSATAAAAAAAAGDGGLKIGDEVCRTIAPRVVGNEVSDDLKQPLLDCHE